MINKIVIESVPIALMKAAVDSAIIKGFWVIFVREIGPDRKVVANKNVVLRQLFLPVASISCNSRRLSSSYLSSI